jgi:hypothetical protein
VTVGVLAQRLFVWRSGVISLGRLCKVLFGVCLFRSNIETQNLLTSLTVTKNSTRSHHERYHVHLSSIPCCPAMSGTLCFPSSPAKIM